MRFACPGCGAIYSIKETSRLTAAGGRVECFRCHEVFTVAVPRDEPAPVPGVDATAPAPVKKEVGPGRPEPAAAAPNEEARPAGSEPAPAAPLEESEPAMSELPAAAPKAEAKPAESEPAPAAALEESEPAMSEPAAAAPNKEARPEGSEAAPAAPLEESKPAISEPAAAAPNKETRPEESEPTPTAPLDESKAAIPDNTARAQKEQARPAKSERAPAVPVKPAKAVTPESATPVQAGTAPGAGRDRTPGPQARAAEGTRPALRRRPPRAAVEDVITGARHEYRVKQEPKQHLAVQGAFPDRSDTLSDHFEPPRRTVIPLPAWAEKAIWGTGALLLLVFLVAQTLWHFRADPGVNVMLSAVCEDIGCDVPLLRQPGALRVTDRVFTRDPDYPNVLVLRLRVANGAGLPQPYPGLELVLYDKAQAVVGKSRVVPAQYRGNVAPRALAPGDLGEIELLILDPGQAATGFAVEFF